MNEKKKNDKIFFQLCGFNDGKGRVGLFRFENRAYSKGDQKNKLKTYRDE